MRSAKWGGVFNKSDDEGGGSRCARGEVNREDRSTLGTAAGEEGGRTRVLHYTVLFGFLRVELRLSYVCAETA